MGLGLISAGGRRCTRACRVAGGTVKLRLASRSTIRPGVFTLLLLLFALVAGVDLLHRVFAVCRVQPEPSSGWATPLSSTSGAKALVSV